MFGFRKEKLYCAIDIEATGFDPLKEEILEIGFAFFKVGNEGLHVTEEWSQVFKPTKPVPNRILGLTGISEVEIDAAPRLSDYKEQIQAKIGNAVLVGHSVGVDVRYLEANGFKLSGKYVDTLELVQFILPTHQSYNLENLMQFFGIDHGNAHRALADAKASIKLLERLMGIYSALPSAVKSDAKRIITPFSFPWQELLESNLFLTSNNNANSVANKKADTKEIALPSNTIVTFGLGDDYESSALFSMKKIQDKRFLYVATDKFKAMKLWQASKGEAIFSSEDSFNEEKFNELMTSDLKSPEIVKFMLKILIWRAVNWQHKTILDLNLSFAGNQYRYLISGGVEPVLPDNQILICDLNSFFHFSSNSGLAERHLVIEGLGEFEQQISQKIGKRASWGYINRLLTSIYNPETNFGNLEFRDEVIALLGSADLFFGITLMNIQSLGIAATQVSRDQLETNAKVYGAIAGSAHGFVEKLKKFSGKHSYETIANYALALESFFNDQPNRVKWVDFGQNYCTFNNLPLELNDVTQEALKNFSRVTFVDCLDSSLLEFFKARLGLLNFDNLNYANQSDPSSILVKFVTKTKSDYTLNFGKSVTHAVALVPAYSEIKAFYERNYKLIVGEKTFFAEGYSGGINKMFNNFQASASSILLISTNLAEKIARRGVLAEEIQIFALPQKRSSDIYGQAVLAHLEEILPNAADLRDLLVFHKIVLCFYTEKLALISVFIEEEADRPTVLLDYLKSMKLNT